MHFLTLIHSFIPGWRTSPTSHCILSWDWVAKCIRSVMASLQIYGFCDFCDRHDKIIGFLIVNTDLNEHVSLPSWDRLSSKGERSSRSDSFKRYTTLTLLVKQFCLHNSFINSSIPTPSQIGKSLNLLTNKVVVHLQKSHQSLEGLQGHPARVNRGNGLNPVSSTRWFNVELLVKSCCVLMLTCVQVLKILLSSAHIMCGHLLSWANTHLCGQWFLLQK